MVRYDGDNVTRNDHCDSVNNAHPDRMLCYASDRPANSNIQPSAGRLYKSSVEQAVKLPRVPDEHADSQVSHNPPSSLSCVEGSHPHGGAGVVYLFGKEESRGTSGQIWVVVQDVDGNARSETFSGRPAGRLL